MKILVIADEESSSLWDYYSPEKLEGIDLIISCGDLSAEYLEFLVTMTKCDLLYVPGNHDSKYADRPPEGCINIDGRFYIYKGIRILGMGGSMKYNNSPYMYTEQEMKRRIWLEKQAIFNNSGIDLLVTHSPARGHGDMNDLPHRGFECFNELMNKCRPLYMLHGHVHASYGRGFKRESEHPSGTKIINAFERYVLEYDETRHSDTTRGELLKSLAGAFV